MGKHYDQLDIDERYEIGRVMGRSASTIGRELRRNSLPKGGYKPEHAVNLDIGAVIAAELHPADQDDTTILVATLTAAVATLAAVDAAPTVDGPAELVTDKGYFGRAVLRPLEDNAWKTRIAESKGKGVSRWRGDDNARRAINDNRARLLSGVAKAALKFRAKIVERSFSHILDRGGMRRTWLRGRDNVHKRYLLHVAGHNLGLLMRLLIGAGTAKEAVARGKGLIFLVFLPNGSILALVATTGSDHTVLVAIIVSTRSDYWSPTSSTGCQASLF